ncbi:MAG: hypothetical protein KC910_37490, partial [Candidatus Eremiobacteraeota bacterium]|nr:hypothetical protein [Candidatus Eremiobacteraeota bacterium]
SAAMKCLKWFFVFFLLTGIGFTQEYEPAMSLHAMLRNIPSAKGGQPTWGGNFADILFAPAGDFSCKVLIKSGDQVLAEFPATIAQRVGTIARVRWKFQFTQLGTTPGPRSVEVYVNDKLAGVLPFSVAQTGGGDAFEPKGSFEFTGPWSDLAHFYYPTDASSQQRVHFVYWAKQGDLGGPAKGMVDLVMRRGDKVLATSRAREVSYADYIRFDQDLLKADGKALMAPDLAAMSGPFVVELKHQGKVIKSYSGSIEGGKFTPHPRSELGLPDRTQFLSPREMNDGGGSMSPHLYTWVIANP